MLWSCCRRTSEFWDLMEYEYCWFGSVWYSDPGRAIPMLDYVFRETTQQQQQQQQPYMIYLIHQKAVKVTRRLRIGLSNPAAWKIKFIATEYGSNTSGRANLWGSLAHFCGVMHTLLWVKEQIKRNSKWLLEYLTDFPLDSAVRSSNNSPVHFFLLQGYRPRKFDDASGTFKTLLQWNAKIFLSESYIWITSKGQIDDLSLEYRLIEVINIPIIPRSYTRVRFQGYSKTWASFCGGQTQDLPLSWVLVSQQKGLYAMYKRISIFTQCWKSKRTQKMPFLGCVVGGAYRNVPQRSI